MLAVGLNSRWRVADSRVEQSPEGGGAPGPASETWCLQVASVSCRRLRPVLVSFGWWGHEVERAVVGFGRLRCAWSWVWGRHDDKRAQAPETAYGCTGGAKL